MANTPFDRIASHIALTFDDVMLVPALSNIIPNDVSLVTRFSQNITLNLPFVLPPVAQLTSAKTAIALAQLGGIGILPHDMPVSAQSSSVSQVKKFQSRIVRSVMTVSAETPLTEALEIRQRYDISNLPVIDESKVLVGLVDLDAASDKDPSQPVSLFMTKDVATVSSSASLVEAYAAMEQKNTSLVIIVDDMNHCVGLITKGDKDKFDSFPLAALDEHGCLRIAASVGAGPGFYDRVGALIDAGVDAIYVDGLPYQSRAVLDMVTHIRRQRAGHVDVVAGNAVNAEMASALIDAGANAICTGFHDATGRQLHEMAGIGLPSLTAIMAIADACALRDIPLLAQGGLGSIADAAKALAAGASCIMIDVIAGQENDNLLPDLNNLSDSIRTAMIYTGCKTIDSLRTQVKFVRVTPASWGFPHSEE